MRSTGSASPKSTSTTLNTCSKGETASAHGEAPGAVVHGAGALASTASHTAAKAASSLTALSMDSPDPGSARSIVISTGLLTTETG